MSKIVKIFQGQTDWQTDRQTDKPTPRSSSPELKKTLLQSGSLADGRWSQLSFIEAAVGNKLVSLEENLQAFFHMLISLKNLWNPKQLEFPFTLDKSQS